MVAHMKECVGVTRCHPCKLKCGKRKMCIDELREHYMTECGNMNVCCNLCKKEDVWKKFNKHEALTCIQHLS